MVWLLSAALAAGAAQRIDAGVFVFALSLLRGRHRLLLLATLAGSFFYAYHSMDRARDDANWFDATFTSVPVVVEGRVSDYPAVQTHGVTFPLDIVVAGRTRRLLVRAARFDIGYGDRLRMRVKRVRPRHDMSEYLLSRRCAGIVRARYDAIEVVPRVARSVAWRDIAARVRNHARETLSRNLGSHAGLPLALLLGERGYVSRRVRSQFNSMGIAHLLALSGMHLGVLIALLVVCARLLRLRSGFLVSVAVVVYLAVVGNIASLERAAIMALILILSRRVQRRANPWRALGCALAAMLLVSPELAFSASFRLSFSAMAAVLIAGNRFLVPVANLRGLGRRFIRTAWGTFATSLAVGLVLVPLQIHYFDTIPVAGPIATLVFFPAVALILALSIAVVVSGSLPLVVPWVVKTLEIVLVVFEASLQWANGVLPDPIVVAVPQPMLYLAALAIAFYHPTKLLGLPVAGIFVAMAFGSGSSE